MTPDEVRALASLIITCIISIAIVIAMFLMFVRILAKFAAEVIADVRELFKPKVTGDAPPVHQETGPLGGLPRDTPLGGFRR